MSFSRRALHMDPAPAPLRGTLTDATVSANTIDSFASLTTSREDAISFNLFGDASNVLPL